MAFARRPSINQNGASTSSSDSTSTVRISSPLNPSSPSLSSSSDPPTAPTHRPRGQSTSTLREITMASSSSAGSPLNRVSSNSTASSLALADLYDQNSSSFRLRSRTRSRSPRPDKLEQDDFDEKAGCVSPTAPGDVPATWWNDGFGEVVQRPWKESPKRKDSNVPAEQTESWVHTRMRVAQAAKSVMGTTLDVTHEVLLQSIDWLDFVPIPGLQTAAKTLLTIWDTVQLIDMNRLQCLRLTERCAEILLSVRQEIQDAGDTVGEELALPISKLNEAFEEVLVFLQKQAHRPWLKRYLKREEITKQISGCDSSLHDALGMFSLSIQIRILKQVQASDRKRQSETQAILESIMHMSTVASASTTTVGASGNALRLSGIELGHSSSGTLPFAPSTITITPSSPVPPYSGSSTPKASSFTQLPIIASPTLPASVPSPSLVLPILESLRTKQNAQDATKDLADLRNLMRAALGAGSDVEMLTVLGVRRDEMPEAIKTLQRALEHAVELEASGSSGGSTVDEEEDVSNAKPLTGGGGLTKMVRRISMQGDKRKKGSPDSRKRALTVSSEPSVRASLEGRAASQKRKDTLDREFIESGIDALRRMSRDVDDLALPSWTITRYEVDREQKIGIGFFSDVYKGTWRGQTVAIKVLAESTPRKLFVREIEIWKALRHPNVLELYGASSASSDPPWFFVSPYERNGSLVEYLRRLVLDGLSISAPPPLPSSVAAGRNRTGSLPGWTLTGAGSGLGTMQSRESGLSAGFVLGRGRSSSGAALGHSSFIFPPTGPVPKEWDLLRFMHEIAKGMEYLHGNGILHGDLKAANVLVDDRLHCVISDFGQSEMKSEAYRISGTPPPHGTLRWQAPELMSGNSQLTTEMDVYAFAISCVEVLSMGRMPWPLMDDESVRHFVLREDSRPAIPVTRFTTVGLSDIVRACWSSDPFKRPTFSKVARDIKLLRKTAHSEDDIMSPQLHPGSPQPRPSPDMHPVQLPLNPTGSDTHLNLEHGSPGSDSAMSFRTARDLSSSPPLPSLLERRESYSSTATSQLQMPEPIPYTPSRPPSSSASSLFASTPSTRSEEEQLALAVSIHYAGYESPTPMDDRLAAARDERRYRLLLGHEFHPSLTLPLWSPCPVSLGAVGYLDRPQGTFVTLLDSFAPEKSNDPSVMGLPSVHGYGKVSTGSQRQDRRNAALRGLDMISGFLGSKSNPSANISRRYSSVVRAGHKAAFLHTESTVYRYIEKLEASKKWFKANANTILDIFGAEHQIQKEDLFYVIGTLDTPDYALFVSHHHPDGQVHFNVHSSPRNGQPWGSFSTNAGVPAEVAGPVYQEISSIKPVNGHKVSTVGNGWETVLLAKLRFKPDVTEPTSL